MDKSLNKTDPPDSFGVFKPVGHIVIAYRTPAALETAEQMLLSNGFVADDVVRYAPEEMLAQVEGDLRSATPLASLGQDLNLVKVHGQLAAEGCSFLVVHAPDDEHADRVATVLGATHPVAAQRYGHFLIEEMVLAADPPTQVFESPERGLDQTVTDRPAAAPTHRN
jgi:hypothetical protein